MKKLTLKQFIRQVKKSSLEYGYTVRNEHRHILTEISEDGFSIPVQYISGKIWCRLTIYGTLFTFSNDWEVSEISPYISYCDNGDDGKCKVLDSPNYLENISFEVYDNEFKLSDMELCEIIKRIKPVHDFTNIIPLDKLQF